MKEKNSKEIVEKNKKVTKSNTQNTLKIKKSPSSSKEYMDQIIKKEKRQ